MNRNSKKIISSVLNIKSHPYNEDEYLLFKECYENKTPHYKFCKIKLKKKRFIKKASKEYGRYLNNKGKFYFKIYLGRVLVKPLRRSLNYSEIGEKLLFLEELSLPNDSQECKVAYVVNGE